MHKPLNILPETGGDSVAYKTLHAYGINVVEMLISTVGMYICNRGCAEEIYCSAKAAFYFDFVV